MSELKSFTQLSAEAAAHGYQNIYGYLDDKAKSLYDIIGFIAGLDSQVLFFLLDSYIQVLYQASSEDRGISEDKRHASKRICNAIRHTLAKRINVKEM